MPLCYALYKVKTVKLFNTKVSLLKYLLSSYKEGCSGDFLDNNTKGLYIINPFGLLKFIPLVIVEIYDCD